MSQDKLTLALNDFDRLLTEKNLSLEIVICGAFAIQLHGLHRGIHTLDVDSAKQINSTEILKAIEHLEKFNAPPQGATQKIHDQFEETIHDLKKIGK